MVDIVASPSEIVLVEVEVATVVERVVPEMTVAVVVFAGMEMYELQNARAEAEYVGFVRTESAAPATLQRMLLCAGERVVTAGTARA